jgi:hypothetical protein
MVWDQTTLRSASNLLTCTEYHGLFKREVIDAGGLPQRLLDGLGSLN